MVGILTTSSTSGRCFDATIAAALEDVNAAIIIQQLHYWLSNPKVGIVVNGEKYVYNSFNAWVKQFPWLSVWKLRVAMKRLRDIGIVKTIRAKSKQWNQTLHYRLDCDRLVQYLSSSHTARNNEDSDLWRTTYQDSETQTINVSDSSTSYIDTKSTGIEETAKTKEENAAPFFQKSRGETGESEESDQALLSDRKEQEETSNFSVAVEQNAQSRLTSKAVADDKQFSSSSIKESVQVSERTVTNKQWRSQITKLDSIGVAINRTIVSLVKMYETEKIENAIALVEVRKREHHIPNLAGYFTSALKGNWAEQRVEEQGSEDVEEVNTEDVFRIWYSLARKIGCCSGYEERDNEYWVEMGGVWEKWQNAIDRGYSLKYLKGRK